MCVRLLVAVVLSACLTTIGNGKAQAQTSIDYHEEDSESVRESEKEIAQPLGETEREIQQQERLRLAALEAELQEELKVARYVSANSEEEGLGAIPGQPGQDYPVYTTVPRTSFTCAGKLVPGYYADIQARCQVFHICDVSGAKHSFLCPRGSLFNQKYLVCDWWYTSECGPAESQSYQHDFNRIDHKQSNENTQHNVLVHQTDIQPQNEYFTNGEENYILVPSDIFHSAETGVPNREKYESSRDEKNEKEHVSATNKERRLSDVNVRNTTRKPETTSKANQRTQLQEKDNRDYF